MENLIAQAGAPLAPAFGFGIGAGLAALGIGIGQGLLAGQGLAAIARQPEKAGDIRTSMIIALVFPELIFLLMFVLCLIK
ncbi:MAG: ATP synthase F0 subunit C [Fimbriimonadaceae bacterium]|nr:ATP synthase F0 subunit C [Fimbriimonadaceae bacterium]QYK56927.1 MAG: ATP synthase F0 subunit C [Fimbriimonadaceae bacterium]